MLGAGVTSALFRLVGVQAVHSFTPIPNPPPLPYSSRTPPPTQACTQFAELGKAKPYSTDRLLRSVLYPGSKVDFLFEPPAPTSHMGSGPGTLASLPCSFG